MPTRGSLSATLHTTNLTQAVFEEPHYLGGYMHFRDTTSTLRVPDYKNGRTFQGMVDTGVQARTYIEQLAATHGWPIPGVFVSASGGIAPHLVLSVWDWPNAQVGGDRESKVGQQIEYAVEALYKIQPNTSFTADPATDILTSVNHGLTTGQEIGFASDGDLPKPLDDQTAYQAIVLAVDTFQASLDGVTPINIQDAGTDAHYINYDFGVDVRRFWIPFHMFTWRSSVGLYVPEVDFTSIISAEPPGVNWW